MSLDWQCSLASVVLRTWGANHGPLAAILSQFGNKVW